MRPRTRPTTGSANGCLLRRTAGDPAGLRLSDLPTGFEGRSGDLAKCMLMQAPHLRHVTLIYAYAPAANILSGTRGPFATLPPPFCAGFAKAAGTRWLPASVLCRRVIHSLLRLTRVAQQAQPRRGCAPLPATETGRHPLPTTDPSFLGRGSTRSPGAPHPRFPPWGPALGLPRLETANPRPQKERRRRPFGSLSVCAHCRPPLPRPRLRFSQPLPALGSRVHRKPNHWSTGMLGRLSAFP